MKTKVVYRCSNCGSESPKWMGKCQSCEEWNTFEEFESQPKTTFTASKKKISPKRLSEVLVGNSDRIVTSISEFNRVLGGGIVKDSIIILTARPGAGKSTLLLQVADDVANKGYKVLYASAEESDSQIKSRSDRILNGGTSNIWIYSDTSMNHVPVSYTHLTLPTILLV